VLFDEIFATNSRGVFFTVQRALPHMNDGAAIVFNAIAPVAPAWRVKYDDRRLDLVRSCFSSSAQEPNHPAISYYGREARGIRAEIRLDLLTRAVFFERHAIPTRHLR
jgi:hypothetical protein